MLLSLVNYGMNFGFRADYGNSWAFKAYNEQHSVMVGLFIVWAESHNTAFEQAVVVPAVNQ